MPELHCDVDRLGTRLVVRVAGELSVPTASTLRTTLMKCLVDQPDAIVVDLTDTTVAGSAALSVFTAVARQAAFWPDTPLLVAAPDAGLAESLANGHSRLTVFRSLARALAAEPRRHTRSIGDVLLPTLGAARRGRDLATEACTRWALPALAGPAGLVAGELVTNAVDHARTMADLRFTLSRRYLMIAVRDGSAEPPRCDPGTTTDPAAPRGLMLVEAVSHRWGHLPTDGGKVVWAALSLPRAAG
ncbi:hypothetical protein ACWT_2818 [Actinoplanes sp. SE50]|uniref:STAS domain-containing protein n=1 Tax=unclassified Actinoplanes TaxID=2626549 RepID=UPI00023EC5CD|nr:MULTISPECIES: STAS domain-containing protein [unclassified Actinoplanes]AEV83623.1 hypothetical protein ACPL_2728 [Actinoplanes sp. SE50/110]ATO82233.1 hypothetical protein ACWT_2818 [Actinoplanes sp. SE50]SLL99640.1 hypothetical protein ACSP50_2871 [Actinoplanes sp. SE50/110]